MTATRLAGTATLGTIRKALTRTLSASTAGAAVLVSGRLAIRVLTATAGTVASVASSVITIVRAFVEFTGRVVLNHTDATASAPGDDSRTQIAEANSSVQTPEGF